LVSVQKRLPLIIVKLILAEEVVFMMKVLEQVKRWMDVLGLEDHMEVMEAMEDLNQMKIISKHPVKVLKDILSHITLDKKQSMRDLEVLVEIFTVEKLVVMEVA
jgi:hypothetical protein